MYLADARGQVRIAVVYNYRCPEVRNYRYTKNRSIFPRAREIQFRNNVFVVRTFVSSNFSDPLSLSFYIGTVKFVYFASLENVYGKSRKNRRKTSKVLETRSPCLFLFYAQNELSRRLVHINRLSGTIVVDLLDLRPIVVSERARARVFTRV